MLLDAGLGTEVPHRNKAERKPELSPEQKIRVRKLYAEDIKLFESIKGPAQIHSFNT